MVEREKLFGLLRFGAGSRLVQWSELDRQKGWSQLAI